MNSPFIPASGLLTFEKYAGIILGVYIKRGYFYDYKTDFGIFYEGRKEPRWI